MQASFAQNHTPVARITQLDLAIQCVWLTDEHDWLILWRVENVVVWQFALAHESFPLISEADTQPTRFHFGVLRLVLRFCFLLLTPNDLRARIVVFDDSLRFAGKTKAEDFHTKPSEAKVDVV